jgi:hypothetical protein
MNYKESGITFEERMLLQRDILALRTYILYLKEKELGALMCEECKKETKDLDIHHKRYGKDITYYDLMLLCEACHKNITDYNRYH